MNYAMDGDAVVFRTDRGSKPTLKERSAQLMTAPWTNTMKPYLIRITPRLITGRRIPARSGRCSD